MALSVPDLLPVDDTGRFADDNVTKATTPTFAGTGATPAALVVLLDGDGTTAVGASVADSGGAWTILSSALADGVHSLAAAEYNASKVLGPRSAPLTVTIDTVRPTVPAPLLAPASDTGTPGDNVTANASPQLLGSFGEVSGPDAKVQLEVSSTVMVPTVLVNYVPVLVCDPIGCHYVMQKVETVVNVPTEIREDITAAVTYSADHSQYAITAKARADGSHPLSVSIAGTDLAGNASLPSPHTTVTVDTVSPAAPTDLALAPGSDTGIPGDLVTEDRTPTLTGKGPAGETIVLRIAGVESGRGTVDAKGAWAITSASLVPGLHRFDAVALDTAGNTSTEPRRLAILIPGSQVDIDPACVCHEEGTGGSTAFTFTLTRSGDTAAAATLAWQVAGTGTHPADAADFPAGTLPFGTFPSGTLTFAPGETARSLTLAVLADGTAEPDEAFAVTLSAPSPGLELGATAGQGLILDDDGARISIAAPGAPAAEGSPLIFTLVRTGDLSQTQSVDWSLAGAAGPGTVPVQPEDFAGAVLPSGTVTFGPGESSRALAITLAADTTPEANEQLAVTLANPSTGALTGAVRAEAVALDNDGARYSIGPATVSAAESGQASFTISRRGSATAPQTVAWSVAGIAGPGTLPAAAHDFAGAALPSGTITFATDDAAHTIVIPFAADAQLEANERFAVTLAVAGPGMSLGRASADGVILNDDSVLTILPLDADQSEDASTDKGFSFAVTRSGNLSQPATVEWSATAAAGKGLGAAGASDFINDTFPSGTLSFAAAVASMTIRIKVNPDILPELDERFAITLSDAAGASLAQATAFGVIRNDDDGVLIERVDADRAEGTGGETGLTFRIRRLGDLAQAQAFDWSVTPADIEGTQPANAEDFVGGVLPFGTATFAAGEASRLVTVPVRPDTRGELNESFAITIPIGTGSVSTTGIIRNDDTSISIRSPDGHPQEGSAGVSTPFTFEVWRTGDLASALSVAWSAAGIEGPGTMPANAADFAAGTPLDGTLSFAPGEARRTLTVAVAGDRSAEANERFAVTLSNPSGGANLGRSVAHGIILDDDIIRSTTASETLTGTGGSDLFQLGGGTDHIHGLDGTDRFRFIQAAIGPAAGNAATMEDFTRDIGEQLDLSAIDAVAGTGANDAFGFIGAAAFSGTPGELRWQDQGGGALVIQGNVDTDTVADLTIFVNAPGPVDGNWFVL